jgi:hypothetical protein
MTSLNSAPAFTPATDFKTELRQLIDCILSCDDLTLAFLKVCSFFDPQPLTRSSFLASVTRQSTKLRKSQILPMTHGDLLDPDKLATILPAAHNQLLTVPAIDISSTVLVAQSSYTIMFNPLGTVDFYLHPQHETSPILIKLSSMLAYLLTSSLCLLHSHTPDTITPDIQSPESLFRWINDLRFAITSSTYSSTASTPVLTSVLDHSRSTHLARKSLSNLTSHPSYYHNVLQACHKTLRPYIGTRRPSPTPITYTFTPICAHYTTGTRHRSEYDDNICIVSIDLVSQFSISPTHSKTTRMSDFNRKLSTNISRLPTELRALILNYTITKSTYLRTPPDTHIPRSIISRSFVRQAFIPIDSPRRSKSSTYVQILVHTRHQRPLSTHSPRSQEPYATRYDHLNTHHLPMFFAPSSTDIFETIQNDAFTPPNTYSNCIKHAPFYDHLSWS